MKAVKVLVVNHTSDVSGAEKGLLRLLDRIDSERFRLGLACPGDGPLASEFEKRGLPVHRGFPEAGLQAIKRGRIVADWRAGLYPLQLAMTVWRLAALIKREDYQVIYTHSAKGDIYGTLAGRLARRPVVWRVHDLVDAAAYSRLNVAAFMFLARRGACRVLAISEAVRQAMLAGGVQPEKVVTVYYSIGPDDFRSGRDRAEVRRELGVPETVQLVGIVGRVVDWKGQDVFVEAAARVHEVSPEARFIVVGDALFGDLEFIERLTRRVDELGLQERFIFTGWRDDVPDVVTAMDVMVHASVLPEPFGLVIFEALSLGTPVVATYGGGVEEMVAAGETAFLFEPGDHAALAAAVLRYLGDPAEARAMAERGRERLGKAFEPLALAQQVERLWLEALGAEAP
ncbi:MAG: glycosyltransferase [Candidatus Geothermincolia bacterium]